MNKLQLAKLSYLVSLLTVFSLLISCNLNNKSEEQIYSKRSIELNDAATAIQMKVVSGEWPKDSLESAVGLYRASIAEDSTNRISYLNYYNSLQLLDRYADAEKLCSEWINNNPDDYDFRLKRANLYTIQGKKELAEKEYIIIGEWLDNQPPLLIDSTIDKAGVEQVVTRAYNLFIIKNDTSEALRLLNKLQEVYPGNGYTEYAINQISTMSREEYLDHIH